MNIPPDVIKIFETEINGISHGTVSLTVHLRDNHPRFVIGRERSILADGESVSHVLKRGDVND
jgi:hypothetical protein